MPNWSARVTLQKEQSCPTHQTFEISSQDFSGHSCLCHPCRGVFAPTRPRSDAESYSLQETLSVNHLRYLGRRTMDDMRHTTLSKHSNRPTPTLEMCRTSCALKHLKLSHQMIKCKQLFSLKSRLSLWKLHICNRRHSIDSKIMCSSLLLLCHDPPSLPPDRWLVTSIRRMWKTITVDLSSAGHWTLFAVCVIALLLPLPVDHPQSRQGLAADQSQHQKRLKHSAVWALSLGNKFSSKILCSKFQNGLLTARFSKWKLCLISHRAMKWWLHATRNNQHFARVDLIRERAI